VRTGEFRREEERESVGPEKNRVHALLEITCDTEND
jgi:hypothetical protein